MPEQPPLDEQSEIKKRAIRRVIVAGVLIAAAIAALTVLTRYKPETPVTKTVETGPVAPPVKLPEPAAPPPEEMASAPTTPLEQEPQPGTPPPPPPEVVNAAPQPAPAEPAKPAKPVAARPGAEIEGSARPAPARPAVAQAAAPAQPPKEMAPVKEQPAKAVKEAVAEKAPPPPARPAEPAPKGYTVQLGVFSNMTNAQQLQDRLAQNGIKSYTETRVNVGPFQNKAEADQALAKIRAMGINAVVVPVK